MDRAHREARRSIDLDSSLKAWGCQAAASSATAIELGVWYSSSRRSSSGSISIGFTFVAILY